jgi:hypothetical protein
MHTANFLLASLSAGDAAAIVPHLQSVHLAHQTVLSEAGDEIRLVYFPTARSSRWSSVYRPARRWRRQWSDEMAWWELHRL